VLASAGAAAQTARQTGQQQSPTTTTGSHDHHAAGHTHHEASPAPDDTVEIAAPEELIRLNRVSLSVPEVEVLDQDGRRIPFHADLVKGKVVVVSFIYTTCVFTCTSQGKSLSRLQQMLGERLGREVTLITVSTDPETDTPAKLKSWGATFGARRGWTFVTGEKTSLERLRKAFPGVRAGRDAHESIIFVGNDARGLWVRADGLRPTREILSLLDAVAAPADARAASTVTRAAP
jgi:protein SCO1/2